jgi:hypothetical protein
MKSWLSLIAIAVVAVAVAGCAPRKVPIRETAMTEKPMAEKPMAEKPMADKGKMEGKMLDGKAIAKILKSGGTCKWSSGSDKGEDFYYATEKPTMGDADRMMGDKTTQGAWAIEGDQLCLTFGKKTCYSAYETGKNAFKGVPAEGAAVDFKC